MEEKTILNEVLRALELHSNKMEKRFDQIDKRFDQVDKKFEQVDKRFEQVEMRLDRLEKKFDGTRVDIIETQETVDFLSSKTIQHEKKLRELKSALS
ncbi:hypothetical protein [Pseudogracilibacillus sp. SO30301A]|uniref:hypothetical protein n=1 Tax=Pseudogracilibacillus sp. SO30301A TaxID=3098291 RepID=UPI00300E1F7C